MSVANKYKIERRYISKGRSRSGEKLVGGTPDFLVAHETANNTADADDHYKYFNRHVISASAHTFIDDSKILEINTVDEKAWHVFYNTPIDNRMFGDDANESVQSIAVLVNLIRHAIAMFGIMLTYARNSG
jgi:N-acetylmuramoyl-L-alanine amidase CwlA